MFRQRHSIAKLERQRRAQIKKLGRVGPFLKGSLVAVENKKCNHTAHMVTFASEGKTKSIYVPVDMVEEARQWTLNYRRVKEILEQISSLSVGIIRRQVTEKKEAKKRRKKVR